MSAVNLEILLAASLSLTLVWTMVTDIRHRIIPNWVVLVVIALAPAMWFISDLALSCWAMPGCAINQRPTSPMASPSAWGRWLFC